MDPVFSQARSTLGLTPLQLNTLRANPFFPAGISDDGQGDVLWNASDISNFATLISQAQANGWFSTLPPDDQLPSANFVFMSQNAVGSFYTQPVATPLA